MSETKKESGSARDSETQNERGLPSRRVTVGFFGDGPECVKVLSPDGLVMHVNHMGLALLEASKGQDLTGRRYADLWPEESRVRISTAIEQAALGGHVFFEGYGGTLAGTPKWWQTAFYGDTLRGGRTESVIAISRDITAERGEAIAAHIARERLISVAAPLVDGVIGIGKDGYCAFLNAAAASMLGHTPQALMAKPVQSFISPLALGGDGFGAADMPTLLSTRAYTLRRLRCAFVQQNGRLLAVSCVLYPMPTALRWLTNVMSISRSANPAPLYEIDALLSTFRV